MCDNCVKSGRMTEAEAAEQRAEMDALLGALGSALGSSDPAELMGRIAVQQISEEYVSVLNEYGYEISLGILESGNVAVGLMRRDSTSEGPGYVLAEFSADTLRKLLR